MDKKTNIFDNSLFTEWITYFCAGNQRFFAEKCGITETTISRIINGKHSPGKSETIDLTAFYFSDIKDVILSGGTERNVDSDDMYRKIIGSFEDNKKNILESPSIDVKDLQNEHDATLL